MNNNSVNNYLDIVLNVIPRSTVEVRGKLKFQPQYKLEHPTVFSDYATYEDIINDSFVLELNFGK